MMTNKTTRTRAAAKKLMWEYYKENNADLPKWISEYREEILEALIQGKSPSFVFWSIARNVQEDTSEQDLVWQHVAPNVAA
jgi:beta-galactosidase/beta-glucuronidase